MEDQGTVRTKGVKNMRRPTTKDLRGRGLSDAHRQKEQMGLLSLMTIRNYVDIKVYTQIIKITETKINV